MKKTITFLCVVMVLAMFTIVVSAEDNVQKAEKIRVAEVVKALQSKLSKEIDSNKEASDGVKIFAKDVLLPICVNQKLAKEVKKQNALNISLDDIKKVDEEWKNAEDELPIHSKKIDGECGKETKRIVKNMPVIIEMFVMDNQGANVGQNVLTSDYWQGDEAKWQNSFKDGKGGVEIGKVEFDKSANAQLQQISLPIVDEKGEIVGAVCFGVKKEYAEIVANISKGIDKSNASDKVKAFAKTKLLNECTNYIFAVETEKQNSKGIKLDEIKRIDEQWVNAEDELAIHSEKTGNTCAAEVKKIVQINNAILEAFVMDNQGANVGQNALTSDFWQGDEAKWKNSYNGGKGGVEIGEVEFDKSANAQIQQISLPIFDKESKVVGAICWGIAVDKIPDGSSSMQIAMHTENQ